MTVVQELYEPAVQEWQSNQSFTIVEKSDREIRNQVIVQ